MRCEKKNTCADAKHKINLRWSQTISTIVGYPSQKTFMFFRAYSRKKGHVCVITKKEKESPVKGHNYESSALTFPNLGHLECCTPLTTSDFEGFNPLVPGVH